MRNGVQRRLSWTSGGEVLGGSQLLRQDGHPRLHLSDPETRGKGATCPGSAEMGETRRRHTHRAAGVGEAMY